MNPLSGSVYTPEQEQIHPRERIHNVNHGRSPRIPGVWIVLTGCCTPLARPCPNVPRLWPRFMPPLPAAKTRSACLKRALGGCKPALHWNSEPAHCGYAPLTIPRVRVRTCVQYFRDSASPIQPTFLCLGAGRSLYNVYPSSTAYRVRDLE